MSVPITTRFTEEEDGAYLKEWLFQPKVLTYFPLFDEREVDDAVRNWIYFAKNRAGLTALFENEPCGMVVIYPNCYEKLSHQSLISIIVDEKHRNKGIGGRLIEEISTIAKNDFNMELLHLEVYEDNPARRLYERLGFEEYGIDSDFMKEDGRYVAKICMQKWI